MGYIWEYLYWFWWVSLCKWENQIHWDDRPLHKNHVWKGLLLRILLFLEGNSYTYMSLQLATLLTLDSPKHVPSFDFPNAGGKCCTRADMVKQIRKLY